MTRYKKLVLVRTIESKLTFLKKLKGGKFRLFLTLCFFPLALPALFRSRKKLIIPYMEIAVTEKCSLNCKDCANLMPYYHNPKTYPSADIIKDLERMEQLCAEIYVLQVLGGEPLMHPELPELLKYILSRPFIRRIQVVTNGTLMPKEALIPLLQNRKVTVLMSDYGEVSAKKPQLIELCAAKNIRCNVLAYSDWLDYGDLSDKKLNDFEIIDSYRRCPSAECKTLIGGKFFSCPRSAHMYNLNCTPNVTDFVDIRDAETTPDTIKEFYNRPGIAACLYCNPPKKRNPIPAAIQTERL